LHRHAFAHAAEAAEVILRKQFEIPGYWLAGLAERIGGGGHRCLQYWWLSWKGRRFLRRPLRLMDER
jgi:hypothetical protein